MFLDDENTGRSVFGSAQELKLASKVFTYSNSSILITNKDNKITAVNKAFEDMTGYTKEEVLGLNPNVLGSGWASKDFYKEMWAEILEHGIWSGRIQDKKKDGEVFHASETIIAIKDKNGEIENFIGISDDITSLVKEQEDKEKILTRSSVTGLKNRFAFLRDLGNNEIIYAALIDIDAFHQINNFYGYEISDKLLENLSSILQSLGEGLCEVYHLNADSFVITMSSTQDVQKFSDNIQEMVERIENHTFVVDDFEILLSVTAVIAQDEAQKISHTLDMCMKYARKNRLSFWEHSPESNLNKVFEENLYWTKELKSAFKEDRVITYFQPIYSYVDMEIQRYETLVRIIDDEGNIFTPNYFLPVAESTNQINKITKIVFLKTLKMLEENSANFTFSVNISFSDMQDSDFLEFVKEHLGDYKIAKRVCFEILETEGITDEEPILEFIKTVHELGCQVAIDDFGSGYANFENLIKLDIDVIKIDGSLIDKVATHQDAYDIVHAIVVFAKKRNMKIIAEYVRNRSIFEAVKSLGIDYAQGYYIDKPKATILANMDTEYIHVQEPYKTLIYVSQAQEATSYEEATNILNSSWNKNRKNNVGGVLIYNKHYFVQLINGPVERIDMIFERISQDKRHHTIRVIGEELSAEKEFDEWNMGFLPKHDAITKILEEHGIQEERGLYNAGFENMKNLLKKLSYYI